MTKHPRFFDPPAQPEVPPTSAEPGAAREHGTQKPGEPIPTFRDAGARAQGTETLENSTTANTASRATTLLTREAGSPMAGSSEPAGAKEEGSAKQPKRWGRLLRWLLTALIALLIAAGLWYFLAGRTATNSSSLPKPADPASASATGVDLSTTLTGTCLRDFTSVNDAVDTIPCAQAHNAQVVGVQNLSPTATYPGSAALRQEADALCSDADFNEEVLRQFPSLKKTNGLPSAESWQDGDRRIDCIVFLEPPASLDRSLLGSDDTVSNPGAVPSGTVPATPGEVVAPTSATRVEPNTDVPTFSPPPSSSPTSTPAPTPSF